MSAILRPEFPKAPHRIPIAGASPSDIEKTWHACDLIFNLAISALEGQLENLRENLPVGEVKFADIYEIMRDCRSDVLGRLEKAADRGK